MSLVYEEGDLDEKFFVPLESHENPHKIVQVKIEHGFCRDANADVWKIWIRGINTMWFRADQCFLHTQEECTEYCHIQEQKANERKSERGRLKAQALAKLTDPEREALGF
jgi:hypothetical protein